MKVITGSNYNSHKPDINSQVRGEVKKAPHKVLDDRLELQSTQKPFFKISHNNPDDPTVSTKVLDGLSSGMINFSQNQRDVLAQIMSDKAERIEL